jgi:hypothetical protein
VEGYHTLQRWYCPTRSRLPITWVGGAWLPTRLPTPAQRRAEVVSAEELSRLCCCLSMAAEVVETIDDPTLQWRRGWDLSPWCDVLVPWGVHFRYQDPQSGERAEVLALLILGPSPPARGWLAG